MDKKRRYTKPFIAKLTDVTITRNGKVAIIEYKKGNVYTTNLEVGEEIDAMSDEEILELHNNVIKSQIELAKNYKHIGIEIPQGKPQIEYFKNGGYWTARGDVLRCQIDDGGKNFETTIWIDDKEFTMQEFGRLLSVFTGWGMRLMIVPDDEIHVNPALEIKDPDEKETGSLALPADFCSEDEH